MAGSWHPIGGGATSSDGWHPIGDGPVGASGSSIYAVLEDQQTAGTNGGDFTSGAWRTRVLNTEVYDGAAIVSLASNQFTPIAGDYIIIAWGQRVDVNYNQMRLYNATAASVVHVGGSDYSYATAANQAGTATLTGKFTANGTDAYELQHQCSLTRTTYGFGIASNAGFAVTREVYARVLLIKVA